MGASVGSNHRSVINHVWGWEGGGGQGDPQLHSLSVWVWGYEGVLLVAVRLWLGRISFFSSQVLFCHPSTRFVPI